ncbi:MAG: lipoprotein insertase outer membrane protein LolB [Undibacterium sp.]|nr:lipoprotein insertase outer membrane protein LolB [Undibacterium sp.]
MHTSKMHHTHQRAKLAHSAAKQTLTHIFSYLLLGVILSACVSTNSTNSGASSARPASKPIQAYQEQVQLAGHLSVQYTQNEKEENLHGSFEWLQNPKELAIVLSSPLGQTIANIKQDKNGASLEQAKKEIITAPDIAQLLNENLGWAIPVNELKLWLQGFDLTADGKKIAIPVQDDLQLKSQGWQLRFVSWYREGAAHPKRIDLNHTHPQLGEVKIRIVIDPWQ